MNKEKNPLHFITTVKFNTLDDLLPETLITSGRELYDYVIMTPDYKWHYYQAYESAWGTRWKSVSVMGDVITKEGENNE